MEPLLIPVDALEWLDRSAHQPGIPAVGPPVVLAFHRRVCFRRRFMPTRLFTAFLALALLFEGFGLHLHELEALHGHEHCADGIGHECHDEEACSTCQLLSAPTVVDDGAIDEGPGLEVAWAVATRGEDALPAGEFSPVSARGPPATL